MTTADILAKYDEQVTGLAATLQNFLKKELKDIIEIPDPAANMIAYGYGPGYTDMICTIILSKKGVKLGFYKGSELPDPAKLLAGAGKIHRYVEIRSEKDIRSAPLKALLKAALTAYSKRKQNIKS